MKPTRPEDAVPLEYETPATRWHGAETSHARSAATAGCFGIVALVLGVPLVLGGLTLIIQNIWEVNRFLRSDAPWETAFALTLGGVLVAAGVRWMRAWRRGRPFERR